MKFIDQLQRTILINSPPRRIISLVPSQTELLFDLGLTDEVIGITKFCIHPEAWFHNKQRVGGTKQLKHDVIEQLQPDLIIANKEENDKGQLEKLMEHFPVWVSDIKKLDDATGMIQSLGEITGHANDAAQIINNISTAFGELDSFKQQLNVKRAAYLIWNDPMMTAGKDTFINHIMDRCGIINVIEEDRYPQVIQKTLTKLDPEYILLSSEPFPFTEVHLLEYQKKFTGAKIVLVDGEYFSWYGSRLQNAPAYFISLLESLQPVH